MQVRKKIILGIAAFAAVLSLAACDMSPSTADKSTAARNDKANSVVLCGEPNQSTECKNLAEKLKRDNNPNSITYVYLFSFGQPIGYFVAKGKVSSTQSQMGPMDQTTKVCNYATTAECYTLAEAPGDDGSFGPNESGIFFFTADGKMIRWNDVYLQVDAPLDLPGARRLYAQ